MEKKIEKRIMEVAEAIVDFVENGESFEIADGVHIVGGKELNLTAEGDGRELVDEDTLHIADDDGSIKMHVTVERIAGFLAERENPSKAFWMIHPQRDTVLLVKNENQEHSYEMTGSFFVNPSAEQDLEAELEDFLEYLESEDKLSIGYFRILTENGRDALLDCDGITLDHNSGTPADTSYPEHCDIDWLTFKNSDPYNRGERKVYEHLENLSGWILNELDEDTINRINQFYPGDIRNFRPEHNDYEPEFDD